MSRLTLLPMMLLAGLAQADVLVLENGDRLTGKVESLVGGTLTFVSDLAGKVKIDAKKVKNIETAEPVKLVLPDGSTVRVVMKGIENGTLQLEGKDIDVSWLNLVAINPPQPKAPNTNWTGSVSSSFGVSKSERDAQNLDVSFDAKKKEDRTGWQTRGNYAFARQTNGDGELQTTRDAWYLRGQYDYFVKDKLFHYANLRFDHDAVNSLDLRTVAGLGAGYTLVYTPKTNYRIELGGSWVDEHYAGSEDSQTFGVQLGSGLTLKVNGMLSLNHDLTYISDPTNLDDYLLVSDLGLRSDFSKSMFSEFRFSFNYDATPRAGGRRDSYRYIMGLGVRF